MTPSPSPWPGFCNTELNEWRSYTDEEDLSCMMRTFNTFFQGALESFAVCEVHCKV